MMEKHKLKRAYDLAETVGEKDNISREAFKHIDQLEAENKELKMCLQYLVDTKKHKELNGKDVTYIQMRKIAWDNANKILKKG